MNRMLKTKFQLYHLFYWLAAFILVGGLFFIGFQIEESNSVVPGWHTTIFVDFWRTIIPLAVYPLIFGIIYRYYSKKGKYISKIITIAHFLTTVIGLLLSMNILSLLNLLLNSNFDLSSLAYSSGSVSLFLMGPIILFVSIAIFSLGILRARPTTTPSANTV